MPKQEFISLSGLRVDGRRPNEIRHLKTRFGLFGKVDGSAYIEIGNTKVIAFVYGPREIIKRSTMKHDRAIVKCQYSMAPFASIERRQKRIGDRRWQELSMNIQKCFESVILTHLHPRSQIDIYLQVLQDDGGIIPASINAATLALIDAGIPMSDYLVSCSVGYLDKTPLLDLNRSEILAGGPFLPIAMLAKSEKIMLIQLNSKLPYDIFEEVSKQGILGCRQVYSILDNSVREHSMKLLSNRGILNG